MMETTKEKKSTWLFYRRRLRFEIFKRDNFKCFYCGRTIADGIQLTLDHIVPVSAGGKFSKNNLITSCFDCNQGKWSDVLSKWELRDLKRLWNSMRPQPKIIVIAH